MQAVRAHERARDERGDEGPRPLLPRQVGARSRPVQGSGLEHVIFRPSFVFGRDGGILPTFRKLASLAPVTPIIGSGQAADPADLGRRRGRLLRARRSTRPRRRTGFSSSAARTPSAGTSSGSG